MCFIVTFIQAQPDWKRPSINFEQKFCKTQEEVDEYKKEYTIRWIEENEYNIDQSDYWSYDEEHGYYVLDETKVTQQVIQRLWKYFANYDWPDGYMDIPFLEMKVLECACTKIE